MTQVDTALIAVPVKQIRPTQMTVGYRWVEKKRKDWQGLSAGAVKKKASEQFFPGVIGPGQKIYITDHHHAAVAILRSLADAKVKVGVQDDLSMLTEQEFWVFMDHRTWVHCYDVSGTRQPFRNMPVSLAKMSDDPYRSLAAEVRDAGGFAKSDLPYLEFLWANYLREHVAHKLAADDPGKAIKVALRLARDKKAAYLPGWAGSP